MTRKALHFVGFRGDEYWSAINVFGLPDFIHHDWDHWAVADVDPDLDTVVFATGDENQKIKSSWNDSNFFVDLKTGKLWSMDNPKAPYPCDN